MKKILILSEQKLSFSEQKYCVPFSMCLYHDSEQNLIISEQKYCVPFSMCLNIDSKQNSIYSEQNKHIMMRSKYMNKIFLAHTQFVLGEAYCVWEQQQEQVKFAILR